MRLYTNRWWMPLAALAVVVMAPVPATATDLRSSLKPTCLTADCSQIQFVLNVESDIYVDWVLLSSSDEALWKFRSLVYAQDMNGSPLDWEWRLGAPWDPQDTGLYLKAGGYLAPEPIYLTAEMDVFSTQESLSYGHIRYQGLGNQYADGGPDTRLVFEGSTVTPEPASMLLLGTGLAGVVGVGRRRRRKDSPEE